MKRKLFYSASDIAKITDTLGLCTLRGEEEFLNRIWQNENEFLQKQYRNDRRKFLLDVRYQFRYLYNKADIDEEIATVKLDLEAVNSKLRASDLRSKCSDKTLFFKRLRMSLIYEDDYYSPTKYTLRGILAQLGYVDRTEKAAEEIAESLKFYRLRAVVEHNVPCDLAKINLDQPIRFRIDFD